MTTKKLIYFNLAALVLLMVLSWLVYRQNQAGFVQQLDGTYMARSSMEFFYAGVRSFLLAFPFVALVLGAIIALFVQRTLPYRQRFVRSFLWALLVIYSCLILMSFVKLVMMV